MTMGQDGFCVLLGKLSDNGETARTIREAIGKKISSLEMKDEVLVMKFEDNTGIRIFDDGQSCCESRYMMTSDKISDFVGSIFTGAELRDAPNVGEEGDSGDGEHEVQFLLINTSLGTFTMETHNVHNGYYGGFYVVAKPLE
jgi:hypothetical protein